MGFCSCTTKFFLFLFNLACSLLGILIVVLGVMANSNGSSLKTFLKGEISTTSIILIVLGVLVFLISFFGCCGVIRENHCMITTYAVLLSAILLVQVAVGIMAFVYHKKFTSEMSKYIENDFDEYNSKPDEIDALQRSIHCCGKDGPSYWGSKIPASCCGLKDGQVCQESDAYTEGCIYKSEKLVKKELNTIGLTALIVAVFELFCIACACFMAAAIRRRSRMMV